MHPLMFFCDLIASDGQFWTVKKMAKQAVIVKACQNGKLSHALQNWHAGAHSYNAFNHTL
jgi:hypothetical protein